MLDVGRKISCGLPSYEEEKVIIVVGYLLAVFYKFWKNSTEEGSFLQVICGVLKTRKKIDVFVQYLSNPSRANY